ncbi:hypothetical protein AMJ80_12215 [bacterium SM23_31]|nr:MAG: hypothetical protein AMJ80_12215 [bacterium SM23_31]
MLISGRFHFVSIFLSILLTVIFIHCGKEKGPTAPGVNVSELVRSGWEFFEQTPPDYISALEQFSLALFLNSNSVEAYTGRGWSHARRAFGPNDNKYSLAADDFTIAVNRNSKPQVLGDAWAGLALVQLVLNKYEEAVTSADEALNINADYVFSHDPEITAVDLKLIKAHAYFFLGEYEKVVLLLDDLQPGVTHPVNQPEVLLIQLQNLYGSI